MPGIYCITYNLYKIFYIYIYFVFNIFMKNIYYFSQQDTWYGSTENTTIQVNIHLSKKKSIDNLKTTTDPQSVNTRSRISFNIFEQLFYKGKLSSFHFILLIYFNIYD